MKRTFAFYAAAVLLLIPAVCSAATYYVSPSGNDSDPGSESKPFRTFQKAISTAQSGDTVFLKSGTYDLTGYTTTLYRPISIVGEDKKTTVLTNGGTMTLHVPIKVKNLKFTNYSKASYNDAVFRIASTAGEVVDGFSIENCIFENVPCALWAKNAAGPIKNLSIKNCTLSNISSSWSVQAIVIASMSNVSYIDISGNTLENIYTTDPQHDAFGILIGKDEAPVVPDHITVSNNTINHLVGGTVYTGYYAAGRGVLLYGNYHQILNNVITDINQSDAHNCIYIKGSYSTIANNILHDCGSTSGGSGDLTIKGNDNVGNVISGNRITGDHTGGGFGIYTKGGVTIDNNYVRKTASGQGVFSFQLLGQAYKITRNHIESPEAAIYLWNADNVLIQDNAAISYSGAPIYLNHVTGVTDNNNTKCTGYNCGKLDPPVATCQNTGYYCTSTCGSGNLSNLNSTCSSGMVCCDSYDAGPPASPTGFRALIASAAGSCRARQMEFPDLSSPEAFSTISRPDEAGSGGDSLQPGGFRVFPKWD